MFAATVGGRDAFRSAQDEADVAEAALGARGGCAALGESVGPAAGRAGGTAELVVSVGWADGGCGGKRGRGGRGRE